MGQGWGPNKREITGVRIGVNGHPPKEPFFKGGFGGIFYGVIHAEKEKEASGDYWQQCGRPFSLRGLPEER